MSDDPEKSEMRQSAWTIGGIIAGFSFVLGGFLIHEAGGDDFYAGILATLGLTVAVPIVVAMVIGRIN